MYLSQASKTEQNKEYGRGNRVRKQVNYCDDDEQLNFFLEDNDPDESNPLPKEKGKRGRKNQKQENGDNNQMKMQAKMDENEDFVEEDDQINDLV